MSTLTVYFDDPWWVAVVELDDGERVRAYRHVFGGEPADQEVLEFVLHEFIALTSRAGAETEGEEPPLRRPNPKRAMREAARLVAQRGISTRAQEALQREREAQAQSRKAVACEQREQQEAARREQARIKARARHRGR